ncbi:MAG TPA: Glu/Leu/Phe/Val dehydrogenase, partial [Firmicutes bacterium]|nr:Glu/Leu/Phe/Val dehydrogenase [Bacillota bacterium]
MAKKTAYETAMEQLDLVGKRMGLSETVIEQLREPERSLKVRFPVRMDDGKVKTFTGYRVQHNSALGPTKGGTRIHPEESYQDVVALSFWMTIKNALAGIPAGGAKGGIVADTLKLSDSELERVCRKYVREIRLVMGTRKDIPGPDIGTPQKIMGWFIDEYEQCLGEHEP